jgi:predicted ATPase
MRLCSRRCWTSRCRRERAAKLAPEELRRRQLAALTAWVLAGARTQPIVMAFEDLHWAGPTSLDLLQGLAERGAQAPLLILATARPEFRPPWSLRSHHSVVSLSPLDRAAVAQMVGELAARHALSKEAVEGVSERTGGVPLFVEEVTPLLLERGHAGALQAIPPTLQQSLAARLDRLGEAREVAQVGAVLGRNFTYALLRSVGGVVDPVLQSALDRLAAADLLIAEGAGTQATYRFKHALIQDAAYDSLLKSRRQALHRRAAEICATSLSAPRSSRKSSPVISPRPASMISPSNGGARRATRLSAARRSRRRFPTSKRRSRWLTRRAPRRCRAGRPRLSRRVSV